jgi:opacity protein-like surface antigen
MNTITKLAACAAFTIISTSAFAEAFVLPLVEFISLNEEGYSTKAGAGAVVGTRLGTQREHEISFECGGTQWNTAQVAPSGVLAAHERFVLCLLNYRYHFGSATAPVRFYAGPALGLTNHSIDIAWARWSNVGAGQDSPWSFTWSGSAGIRFKLTEKIELDAGCRYLHVQSNNATLAGDTHTGKALEAHAFYAGAEFRF